MILLCELYSFFVENIGRFFLVLTVFVLKSHKTFFRPAELMDAEPELLTGAILPPTEIPLESEADDEDLNQVVF